MKVEVGCVFVYDVVDGCLVAVDVDGGRGCELLDKEKDDDEGDENGENVLKDCCS